MGLLTGVGLAVALFCDLRFVRVTAKLTTAAPKLGLPAEYGMSWMLPRLIGVTRAEDLMLSGRFVTGVRDRRLGPVERRPPGRRGHRRRGRRYAAELAATVGPSALRTTKRQIYDDLLSHDVGAALVEARRLLVEAMGTAEYREGVAAFQERRPPKF